MVQHTARRIGYLVGAAQVLARSEYVGSVSAERSQRSPRRDRNCRRLRDDQRTAAIENWRWWDIWRGRDCADAIPTDKETVASASQQTRAKNMQRSLGVLSHNIVRDKR